MRYVITNAFGPQNRGDHELLQSLVGVLKDYGRPGSIEVFTTYPEESRAAFSEDVVFYKSPFYRPNSFSELLVLIWDAFFWVISASFPFFSRFLTRNRRDKFSVMRNADMMLLCPGGYLYTNGLSFYVNILNALPYKVCSGVKIASPMSVGPFGKKIDYILAKQIFKHLDLVHARESFSFELVKRMGVEVVETPDLAWWHMEEDSDRSIDCAWDGCFVGTVIDWAYPFSDDANEMRARYEREILKACKLLSERSGGNPVILYNQVGSGDGRSADERLIARLVDRSVGTIVFDPTAVTPDILRERMRGARGLLASRFHSALFAIQTGTPFIAIAYQPKAEYILKDLGLGDLGRLIEFFDGREVAESLIGIERVRSWHEKRIEACRNLARDGVKFNFIDRHFQ